MAIKHELCRTELKGVLCSHDTKGISYHNEVA
jgi:hypothetical protein